MKSKNLPLRARLCRLVSDYLSLNLAHPKMDSAIAALRLHAAVQEWFVATPTVERVAKDEPQKEICHNMFSNLLHLLALQRRSGRPDQAVEVLSLEVFLADRFTSSAPSPASVEEVASV